MQPEILVPLDGSVAAEAILPHAQHWARVTASTLHLLRVVPLPQIIDPLNGRAVGGTVPYERWAHERALAHAYLEGVRAVITAGGVPVTTTIHEGEPATAIVIHATVAPAVHGIAMATHGRRGLERMLFGSVAETVLQAAPKPLLVIHTLPDSRSPTPTDPVAYRTILVPLDGTPGAEKALAQALPLITTGMTTLVLVCAVAGDDPSESPDTYLARLAQQTGLPAGQVQTRLLTGAPIDTILGCSAQVDADLIVMAPQPLQGLDRLLYGSVTWEVIRRASRPVLLAPS